MSTILLVEDNSTISKGLKYSFENSGFNFIWKANIKEAIRFLEEKQKVDLAILDIGLPDGNGIDLFQNYVKPLEIPSLFLTAKDDEDIIVKGLEIGAEDYITKPFSSKELLARINKILMRNQKKSIIQVQNIQFDMDKMEVYNNSSRLELTSLELKLLHLLFLNLNKVVTRSTILDKIWEWTGNDVDDHTVTVYFKRIREKLGDNDIITTIKGIGYRVDGE
ncbi:MAG: response regulator transcription factor [Clostridia bacterium]|nr:response regulator transcription factor [Clostridia bacterium]